MLPWLRDAGRSSGRCGQDGGQNVLDSVRFAFWALNEEYAPIDQASGKHTRAITPANTIVIASSISNGGGESLQALEQDPDGLIDGLAVTEPNAQPHDMTEVTNTGGDVIYNDSEGGAKL